MTAPITPGGVVRGDVYAGAEFSPCDRYRFRLWRVLEPMLGQLHRTPRVVAWCMLNPSTADESKLDPTLRRVAHFSAAWGYDGFIVVNLFAWRATDPRAMPRSLEAVGAGNDEAIDHACRRAHLVVCGWGAHETGGRADYVLMRMRRVGDVPHHLGLTKDGQPRHPLYLRGDVKPIEWSTP